MGKIFISHSTKDEIGPTFVKYLETIGIQSNDIFCSSNPTTGVAATQQWFESLFDEIRKCDTVILVATQNYLRSGISLLEAGAALGIKKNIIILAFPNVDLSEVKNMFHGHQLIDFSLPDAYAFFKTCIEKHIVYRSVDFDYVINETFFQLIHILESHQYANPENPPIGMNKENDRIIRPCYEYGIKRLSMDQIDMTERIKKAKKIKILTTTGIGFFRRYNISDYNNNPLYQALLNGCEIDILLGNPSGPLLCDVAAMEHRPEEELNKEFVQVVRELNNLVQQTIGDTYGKIRLGNVDTSLRQTVILIYDESVWGWTTATLPPARCNARSLSLELQDIGSEPIIKKYETYFDTIWQKAMDLQEVWTLDGSIRECFRYEGSFALEKWMQKQETARKNMSDAEANENNRLLIECAAQHPLNPDGTPGKEYKARLDRCIALYQEYVKTGWSVDIYVPGSLHQVKDNRDNYVPDPISLSESGERYLLDKEVPKENILGQKVNEKYKGHAGVYCSADECFVSSNLFFDGNYQRFFVVCSPAQAMRKALYYLLFSTLPIIYTESPQSHNAAAFHNYAQEAIISIPNIIKSMDDMQSDDCEMAKKMRMDRNPNFNE